MLYVFYVSRYTFALTERLTHMEPPTSADSSHEYMDEEILTIPTMSPPVRLGLQGPQ